MFKKEKIDMITSTDEYFFAETEVFNADQGLKVAIAFTGYDNEQEWILPPEIGTLIYQTYEWGIDENGDPRIILQDLDTHICTPEELNLTEKKDDSYV